MARFNPLATTAASEHRPSRRPRHRLCSEELQLQHEILLLEHERQLLGLDTRRQSSHTSTLYAGVHRGRGSRTSPGGTLPSRASSTASKLFTTTTLLSLLPSRPHFPVKIPSSCSLPLVKRETVVRTSKITVKVTFTLLLWEALLQWMYVGCLHLLRHQILEVGFDDYDCDPRDWVCGLSWHAPLMGLLFTIRCSMNFLLIRRHNYELTAMELSPCCGSTRACGTWEWACSFSSFFSTARAWPTRSRTASFSKKGFIRSMKTQDWLWDSPYASCMQIRIWVVRWKGVLKL
ncbi:unnamed protein product [Amoebophrya sp. A120]|nr:unnamed protein product [Amoebophrya sp. A120]|eukprot:GSA120T00019929001.1